MNRVQVNPRPWSRVLDLLANLPEQHERDTVSLEAV
jgi:hypothetical protein